MSDHPPTPTPTTTKMDNYYTSFFARAHPLKVEYTTAESYVNDLKGKIGSMFDSDSDGVSWWPLKPYERPLKEGEVRLRWSSKCCGTELTWIVSHRFAERYEEWLKDADEPASPAFVGAGAKDDDVAGVKSEHGEGDVK